METVLTWILTCLSITGVVLTVKKSRLGYAFFVVANAGWITVNIRNGIYAQAFLFVVYTCLSVWGFIEWTRHPPCRDEARPDAPQAPGGS